MADDQQALTIFGWVTRGDGAPIPGTALTLCDLAGDQLDRTVTDDDGRYGLEPTTGGTYLVICSSSTHQPKAALVAVADAPVRHDVALAGGGATLEGTVGTRGPDDDLTGTADVVLTLTDVRGVVAAVARSDADGAYRFAALAEGSYTLTAAAPDVAPVAETVVLPGEGRVRRDVVVATSLRLAGVVRSASGGRPVGEALATLVSAEGDVVGAAVTDDDGAFSFGDVRPGTYTITASGYAPVASEIVVGAGQPSEVTLVLDPPALREPDRGVAGDPDGHRETAAASPGTDVSSESGHTPDDDPGAAAPPTSNGHRGRHASPGDTAGRGGPR